MTKLKTYEGKDGEGTDFYLWHYLPSLPLALAVAGLFTIATLWMITRIFRTRTWFSIAFAIGGIMEAIGFATRAIAREHTEKLLPYSLQLVLILVAPAVFAASIYMALSRLIRCLHAESLSIISPRWLTKMFILGDVLSFLVQSGGGSLASNDKINPDIPKYVVLVGLYIQIIIFGLFIVTSLIFNRRMRASAKASLVQINWQRILIILYVASVLIMVRSIFRVVEYTMGIDSYLFTHEWPTYGLDGGPMLVAIYIWVFWYPSELSRFNIHGYSSEDIALEAASDRPPSVIRHG